MRDTDEDDATACLRWLRATEGDPNDARPDEPDDEVAPPANVTPLLVVDDNDDSADADADAEARPRSRVGRLPQYAWDNLDAETCYSEGSTEVYPSGARLGPYDYVAAVAEFDIPLAAIENRLLIIRNETAADVARSLHMSSSFAQIGSQFESSATTTCSVYNGGATRCRKRHLLS